MKIHIRNNSDLSVGPDNLKDGPALFGKMMLMCS